MKKVLILISLFLSISFISVVNASIDSYDSEWTYIENNSYNFQTIDMIDSKNNHLILANNDRYYIFYAHSQNAGGYEATTIRYAYSEVNDSSTWNIGGYLEGIYYTYSSSNSYVGEPKSLAFSVAYNSEEDLIYIPSVYGANTNNHVRFNTYSISEIDYELDDESEFDIYPDENYIRQDGRVDIVLDENNFPMFAIMNKQTDSGLAYACIFIANTTTPTSLSDGIYYEINAHAYNIEPVLIPYGNRTFMMIFARSTTSENVEYMIVNGEVDTNASVSYYSMSDDAVFYKDFGSGSWNYQNYAFMCAGYTNTRVCVSYVNSTGDLRIITFDKAPLGEIVFTEVYGGISSNATFEPWCNAVMSHNDEFFVFQNYYSDSINQNTELYILEENNGNWDSELIVDNSFNWTYNDYYSKYTFSSFYVPKIANNDGTFLLFTQTTNSTTPTSTTPYFVLLNGEITGYSLPSESEGGESNYFVIDANGWFLMIGFIVMIGLFVFALSVKEKAKYKR